MWIERADGANGADGTDAVSDIGATWIDAAEWKQLDLRLRAYAQHRSALDAAEAFDLTRAEQLKIHVVFGYAHLYEYMEHVLGYAPHTARERMRVARALAGLPETTAALSRGALTYSAVRELTRVATAETETAWLARTEGLVANQIERLVANHRPGDQPDDPTDPDLRPRVVRSNCRRRSTRCGGRRARSSRTSVAPRSTTPICWRRCVAA
jgi:hypothetical protein